jgi:hypothetical protein
MRNRRTHLPMPLLACAAVALSALLAGPATSARAAPTPSDNPGYWAETSCSEGEETAFTEGWKAGTAGGYPKDYPSINTCSEPHGSLLLKDEGLLDSQDGSGPTFVYEAPANSTIAGGMLKVNAYTPNTHGEVSIISTPGQSSIFGCTDCGRGKAETIELPKSTSGSSGLLASATCIFSSPESECSKAVDAELEIISATIMLHEEATPTGSGFGGSLLEDPRSGNARLAFEAHDENGPGVYRVSALLGGQALWAATPNLDEGTCVAYGSYDGALNFRSRQPCPQETAVNIEIPTASIAAGQHLLEVEVEDAAGNTAVVYEHTITVRGEEPGASVLPTSTPLLSPAPVRGPANGSPASENAILTAHWTGTSASRLTSAYGRSHELTGRLTTASGTPIADALIEASQKPASLDAISSSLSTTHTAADGTFTLTVPASDSSTSIELAYRNHLGDPQPVATRTLTLQVHAGLRLTVSPHVISVGHTIVLRGSLAGPIPPGGKQVVLEARAAGGGQWIEFHTATAGAHGRFKATHRFTFPGPVRYQFRVVSKREADFPFLAGTSNVVRVRER